jgi:polar amino acid transport system substrate-binding protein
MRSSGIRFLAWRVLPACLLSLLFASVATAQSSPPDTLVVAVKEAPPFAIRGADGRWSGISIDLWQDIATTLDYRFELRETDLDGLLEEVASGAADAGVAAVTVTLDREARMDFTHPFHVSGLGIAVRTQDRQGWLAVAEQLFSFQFLQVVGGLVALLFVVGWLVWLFERRQNPDQFGGSAAHGLGASFWWSAVTMTTVGYGDKAPRSVGGRLVALLWMFTALVVISGFTASITASLTVGALEGVVAGPEDLPDVRVGTVAGSTSVEYLTGENVAFTEFASAVEALESMADGRVDAVVYDAPILRYDVRQQFRDTLAVLPVTFERQLYAIALPSGSPLREDVNQALLRETVSAEWPRLLSRYLGEAR